MSEPNFSYDAQRIDAEPQMNAQRVDEHDEEALADFEAEEERAGAARQGLHDMQRHAASLELEQGGAVNVYINGLATPGILQSDPSGEDVRVILVGQGGYKEIKVPAVDVAPRLGGYDSLPVGDTPGDLIWGHSDQGWDPHIVEGIESTQVTGPYGTSSHTRTGTNLQAVGDVAMAGRTTPSPNEAPPAAFEPNQSVTFVYQGIQVRGLIKERHLKSTNTDAFLVSTQDDGYTYIVAVREDEQEVMLEMSALEIALAPPMSVPAASHPDPPPEPTEEIADLPVPDASPIISGSAEGEAETGQADIGNERDVPLSSMDAAPAPTPLPGSSLQASPLAMNDYGVSSMGPQEISPLAIQPTTIEGSLASSPLGATIQKAFNINDAQLHAGFATLQQLTDQATNSLRQYAGVSKQTTSNGLAQVMDNVMGSAEGAFTNYLTNDDPLAVADTHIKAALDVVGNETFVASMLSKVGAEEKAAFGSAMNAIVKLGQFASTWSGQYDLMVRNHANMLYWRETPLSERLSKAKARKKQAVQAADNCSSTGGALQLAQDAAAAIEEVKILTKQRELEVKYLQAAAQYLHYKADQGDVIAQQLIAPEMGQVMPQYDLMVRFKQRRDKQLKTLAKEGKEKFGAYTKRTRAEIESRTQANKTNVDKTRKDVLELTEHNYQRAIERSEAANDAVMLKTLTVVNEGQQQVQQAIDAAPNTAPAGALESIKAKTASERETILAETTSDLDALHKDRVGTAEKESKEHIKTTDDAIREHGDKEKSAIGQTTMSIILGAGKLMEGISEVGDLAVAEQKSLTKQIIDFMSTRISMLEGLQSTLIERANTQLATFDASLQKSLENTLHKDLTANIDSARESARGAEEDKIRDRVKRAFLAMDGVGTTEDELMAACSGVSAAQGHAMQYEYYQQWSQTLRARIRYECDDYLTSADFERAVLAAIDGDRRTAAAYALRYANGFMGNFGNRTSIAASALQGLTDEDRAAMKGSFTTTNGEGELETFNMQELADNFGSLATSVYDKEAVRALADMNKTKKQALLEADAIRLHEAMDSHMYLPWTYGTDEAKVYAILGKRDAKGNQDLAQAYADTAQRLNESLRARLNIDEEESNIDATALEKRINDEFGGLELFKSRALLDGDKALVKAVDLMLAGVGLNDDNAVISALGHQTLGEQSNIEQSIGEAEERAKIYGALPKLASLTTTERSTLVDNADNPEHYNQMFGKDANKDQPQAYDPANPNAYRNQYAKDFNSDRNQAQEVVSEEFGKGGGVSDKDASKHESAPQADGKVAFELMNPEQLVELLDDEAYKRSDVEKAVLQQLETGAARPEDIINWSTGGNGTNENHLKAAIGIINTYKDVNVRYLLLKHLDDTIKADLYGRGLNKKYLDEAVQKAADGEGLHGSYTDFARYNFKHLLTLMVFENEGQDLMDVELLISQALQRDANASDLYNHTWSQVNFVADGAPGYGTLGSWESDDNVHSTLVNLQAAHDAITQGRYARGTEHSEYDASSEEGESYSTLDLVRAHWVRAARLYAEAIDKGYCDGTR